MREERKHSFDESMERGKQGEADILRFLHTNLHSEKIIDVRDIQKYRDLDIDFLREYTHAGVKKNISIEIKTDDQAHYTKNFFFEEISNTTFNTLGCFVKTKADWIFYYIKETREIHILPTKQTQEWFLLNRMKYKEIPIKNVDRKTGNKYYSKGRIVKIQDVLDNLPVNTITFDDNFKITDKFFSEKAKERIAILN